MSWFESRSVREKKTAVKNVIAVMLADGRIDPSEMKFLAIVCKRVGISERDLKDILDNPQSITFTPADSLDERMKQLLDIVLMMLADGHIDERELDLCISIGRLLGFQPSAITRTVEAVVDQVERSRRDVYVNDIATFLR